MMMRFQLYLCLLDILSTCVVSNIIYYYPVADMSFVDILHRKAVIYFAKLFLKHYMYY